MELRKRDQLQAEEMKPTCNQATIIPAMRRYVEIVVFTSQK
jgi:hypothetical protein